MRPSSFACGTVRARDNTDYGSQKFSRVGSPTRLALCATVLSQSARLSVRIGSARLMDPMALQCPTASYRQAGGRPSS
jgi:hypothetical protein